MCLINKTSRHESCIQSPVDFRWDLKYATQSEMRNGNTFLHFIFLLNLARQSVINILRRDKMAAVLQKTFPNTFKKTVVF